MLFKQIDVPCVNTGAKFEGWRLCPSAIQSDPIIYSGGIGRDIDFELKMAKKYNAEVYAFDPTPRSLS